METSEDINIGFTIWIYNILIKNNLQYPTCRSTMQIQKQNPKGSSILDVIALPVKQYGRTLYVFPLSAGRIHDLITSNVLDIDRWSPSEPDGYQRTPTDSRFKRYGKFVAEKKGISPTSILFSLRDKSAALLEKLEKGAVHLTVSLEKGGKLYIPDGQHRAYGLRWGVDTYPGVLEDYEAPIVLFIPDGEDPRYEEAEQFFLINNNAKRVRTDLAQRYLLRQVEKDLGAQLSEDMMLPADASLKDLEPYAVFIADRLNESGSLEQRIEPPNMNIPSASISQSSFIDSIKPFLSRAAEARWKIKKTIETINAFWTAISQQCPEAFEHWADDACETGDTDHFDAVLATTTGMYSLNDILARSLLLHEVTANPTSPQVFTDLITKARAEEDFFSDGPDGYWASKSSNGAASHGTSHRSFNEIAGEIWTAIRSE